MNNGAMLNAYPDSLGGGLGGAAALIGALAAALCSMAGNYSTDKKSAEGHEEELREAGCTQYCATVQDVVDFQQKWVKDRTYYYAILGDKKELDMNALKKLGTVVELKTEDIFGY